MMNWEESRYGLMRLDRREEDGGCGYVASSGLHRFGAVYFDYV